MANIKITELPGLSVLTAPNQFPVVSSGVTFNVTAGVMQTFMSNVANAITVNSNNTATAVINGGSNGVGNIGAPGAAFNTVFATATTAQYADLAEMYATDANYTPGTVVMFGGLAEVTQCQQDSCPKVAGVISTNPAYLMNSAQSGPYVATVALVGRVPCRVIGPVEVGAMMVSAGNGIARAEVNPAMGTVIGKAVQAHAGGFGTIEIVVGRL
jgi:hypothetical protein